VTLKQHKVSSALQGLACRIAFLQLSWLPLATAAHACHLEHCAWYWHDVMRPGSLSRMTCSRLELTEYATRLQCCLLQSSYLQKRLHSTAAAAAAAAGVQVVSVDDASVKQADPSGERVLVQQLVRPWLIDGWVGGYLAPDDCCWPRPVEAQGLQGSPLPPSVAGG
jgi:hypothetical protein